MTQIIDSFSMSMRSAGRQLSSILLAYGIIAVLLLTTYCAFIFAIASALAYEYGPVLAAVIVGLTTLVIAGGVYIWASARIRRFRRRQHLRTAVATVQRTMIAAAIPAIVPAIVRVSPVVSLLAVAAVAAYLTRTKRG